MSRAEFNGVNLDVPTGWTDASTIVLTGPRSGDTSLPVVNPIGGMMTPSMMLSRQSHEDGEEVLEQIANQQCAELTSLPGAKLLNKDEVTLPFGPKALRQEFALPTPDGGRAQQMHLCFVYEKQVYFFVGTATASPQFDAHRDQFMEVLGSLQIS